VRRRWACPPEGGAAATPNSTLLHSETLCPELVLYYFFRRRQPPAGAGAAPNVPLPIQKPFAKNLYHLHSKTILNGERGFGGGQPCGLAAASARGRRPPKAGGGPTKYHRLALRNFLHRVGISSQKPQMAPSIHPPPSGGAYSLFCPKLLSAKKGVGKGHGTFKIQEGRATLWAVRPIGKVPDGGGVGSANVSLAIEADGRRGCKGLLSL
jgi:hypothetical protein